MTDQATPTPRRTRGRTPLLGTLALGALLAISAAACSGGGASATPAAPPASEAPGQVPQAIIDNAIEDAANRAGADPAEITVVLAEAKDWPDGALGCPEPGTMYTQVITPGYQVVVQAGAVQYDYRASSASSDVHWCENPPAM